MTCILCLKIGRQAEERNRLDLESKALMRTLQQTELGAERNLSPSN